jgi:Cu2+-exporting ATPase
MAAAVERDMRDRFLVSFVLTIPVILYSELGKTIFGDTPPAPFGLSMEWMGFILTTPVVRTAAGCSSSAHGRAA